MQSEYLLIRALLAMNRIEIVTRISCGTFVVNFVRYSVVHFHQKTGCLVLVFCVEAGDVDIHQLSLSG